MTTAIVFWHAICVHIRCTSFLNTFEALETEGGGEDAPGSGSAVALDAGDASAYL